MSIKVCSSKQIDELDIPSVGLNDDEGEEGTKSDAVSSDNCTEYSVRNPVSVDDEKDSSSAKGNKKDSDEEAEHEEDEGDNDEASLDSNFSNKSNSAVSKASNDTNSQMATSGPNSLIHSSPPLLLLPPPPPPPQASHVHTRTQITSNTINEFDESIIITDDDEQDDLPLSQMLNSIKKSKSKDEANEAVGSTSTNASTNEVPSKSASFKEYLFNLKKRTLDQKAAREATNNNNNNNNKMASIESQLKRQCKVCKKKVHQDVLNDHYASHFEVSSKCPICDKVSKSSPLYVAHLLSHLPPQFLCVLCQKWFKQNGPYQRHKESCSNQVLSDENEDEDDEEEEESSMSKTTKKGVNEKEERPGRKAKINQTIVRTLFFKKLFFSSKNPV
jgi:hypothetical protein